MRKPPVKRAGTAKQARRFDGVVLDVRSLAHYWGTSEHTIRARARRRQIPFKKMNGRLLFLKNDIDRYLEQLPGCDLDEAVENLVTRRQ